MRFSLGLFILLFITACTPAAEEAVEETSTAEADVAAIGQLGQEFSNAYNAGDAAALADLFTDDAVLIPPDAAPYTGKDSIQSRYQARFDQFTVEHSLDAEETEVAGDWAFSRGTYKVLLTPKEEGEPIEVAGMHIVISQRQADDSWKIARLIWNSTPPPGVTS